MSFKPWYIGMYEHTDGSVSFIEAVNGGPFRTIDGAAKSLAPHKGRGGTKSLHVVELMVKGKVRKL